MEEKCDPLSESFDAAFSTLDLVNAPDMDVFMKAIMLMDEKEAQCLRGELNHVLCKHLDSNEKLKQKLIENDYSKFNAKYLVESSIKLRENKMKVAGDRILQIICSILKRVPDISYVTTTFYNYVDIISEAESWYLTEEHWATRDKKWHELLIDPEILNEVKQIHECLLDIATLLSLEFEVDIQKIACHPINGPLMNSTDITGMYFKFIFQSISTSTKTYAVESKIQSCEVAPIIAGQIYSNFLFCLRRIPMY